MKLRKRIFIEISPGELVDRLTIMEIRFEHVTDPEQLGRVRFEVEELRRQFDEAIPSEPRLDRLEVQLRAVNRKLWELEDEIRLAEAGGDFGPRFIALARAICRENDHRARLKERISRLCGANRVEDKHYSSRCTAGTVGA